LLNLSGLRANFQAYSEHNIDTAQIDPPMFARFPLAAQSSDNRINRLAEWWPAALLGLVALLSAAPDSNAQTLLGLF
jgi:hypothetical protein